MVDEKNDWRSKAEQSATETAAIKTEIESLRQQVAGVTGQTNSDIPQFQTVEELTAYLTQLPAKIKAELLAEQEAKSQSEAKEKAEIDEIITSQLDTLAQNDPSLLEKEGRDAFLKWALEYDQTNLEVAHKLYSQLQSTKEAAAKKGEEIGLRKANSGLKTSKSSEDSTMRLRPGETLESIVRDAKLHLRN